VGFPKITGNKQGNFYRFWLAIALLCAGAIAPYRILAQTTPAGTQIENRATGTFEDPSNPGVTIPVESNTVVLTVAEIAGITVQPDGARKDGEGPIEPGDRLFFRFSITNVGNDPTRFRIPNSATVSGAGTVSGNLEISTDGGNTWTEISGSELITGSIPIGGNLLVRVPVTVNGSATEGDEIRVQLGNTPNSAQNVERTPNGTDVFTVDNPEGAVPTEATGDPFNGTREASAFQTITVASTPLALPVILKTHGTPVEIGDPANPADDVITYQLALDVRSRIPAGASGFVPGNLAPNTSFPIAVDGAVAPRILVSDAIPQGTALVPDSWQAPAGWQVVFTADNPEVLNANLATWTTDPGAIGGAANATRIGFIFDGILNAGTTTAGFQFQLVTSGLTGPGTIANVAQVFGGTEGNPGPLLFDESGDQNPNNFNDDGTPPPTDDTGNPIVTPGLSNPGRDGQDEDNNNGGSGPGGEANVVVISGGAGGILNGPPGSPGAIGPTDNNDDFHNKVVATPPNLGPNEPFTPDPVAFTNSLSNASGADVTIAPIAPQERDSLPNGTRVTVTFDQQTAIYTYDRAAGFRTDDPPVTIPGTTTEADYSVTIALPTAVKNRGYGVPIAAFDDRDDDGFFDESEPGNVKIDRVYTGFIEILKESRILKGSGPDVLDGQEQFSQDTKTPGPGNLIEYRLSYNNISEAGGPGNVTLTAENLVISEDGTTYDPIENPGGNNWALDTDDADGDNDPTTGIDTSHVLGSPVDSRGGTINFFGGRPPTARSGPQSGTTTASDVSKYEVRVRGPLGPGETGTFTFQRRVN